jgi:hypothetical protein
MLRLLVEGADVALAGGEAGADLRPGDVVVEQQPHPGRFKRS